MQKMTDSKLHEKCNCIFVGVIAHGHTQCIIDAKDQEWDTEKIVEDLDEVESLRGKPKIMLIKACRTKRSKLS